MSREYLGYGGEPNYDAWVRFVSERIGLKLKNIFHAFNVPDIHRLLRDARFKGQVIVGYTSLNEGNV